MPQNVLVDFVVLPPGHGKSVTEFWGWDAHEAQLRCPDDVGGDIGGCSARRALKPKFHWPTQTMVTARICPFRENCHGRAGNRFRDLMISSQRLWPLDHEACRSINTTQWKIRFGIRLLFNSYKLMHYQLSQSRHGLQTCNVFMVLIFPPVLKERRSHAICYICFRVFLKRGNTHWKLVYFK